MTLQLPTADPARSGLLRRVLRPRRAAQPGQVVEWVDRDGRIRLQPARR